MATDDERREVARRLRDRVKNKAEGEMLSLNGSSAEIRLLISSGVFGDKKYHSGADLINRLADLIEPSGHECVPGECPINVRHDNDRIDRDALLALASSMSVRHSWLSATDAERGKAIARRIHEACGEEVS